MNGAQKLRKAGLSKKKITDSKEREIICNVMVCICKEAKDMKLLSPPLQNQEVLKHGSNDKQITATAPKF
jgi:hypothetical protein